MTKPMPFERVTILGVGLLGGSLGLALKRKYSGIRIYGLGRNPARLEIAHKMGAIDEFGTDPTPALKDRDLIILATPVEHILSILVTLGGFLSAGSVVTDVGSTKRLICRKAKHQLPSQVEFVGGHPLAGREVLGVENSLPGLFHDAPYVLCPHAGTKSDIVQRLFQMVEAIGAHPIIMDPEEHDQVVAWTSHLPQLLSTAVGSMIAERGGSTQPFIRVSGSGFRDMIRLGGSPYSLWQGIVGTNDDNIDLALEALIRQLEKMRSDLKGGRLSHDFERALEFYTQYRNARTLK